jgi:hypothetical protein
MCAQRMFRSGPSGDVVKSSYSPRPDERQGSFDLGSPPSDDIQRKARHVAERLASITGTPGDPDETDAHRVNAQIAMVAEEANILITALITDAEAQGLEATGPWLDIPLVECREFAVPRADPVAQEADDILDRKLNS